jgi:hypothetical protein
VPRFYTRAGLEQVGDPLDVASDTGDLLKSYANLDPSAREQFNRAAYWYGQYSHAWDRSISAAFVALICAVEALIPPQPGGPRCPNCGRDTRKGPTQQFVDELERLAPSREPGDTAARRELYRIRSKLSHGWALLRMDVERAAFLHPATSLEREHLEHAQSLTRRALIGWLRPPPSGLGQASGEVAVLT